MRAMLIGYCRSTPTERLDPLGLDGSGVQNQERVLRAAGCRKFFIDTSENSRKSNQRDAALSFMREGDVLVVTSIDRIAKSAGELMDVIEQLADHGASLRVLMFGGAVFDTSEPESRRTIEILSATADWEFAILNERPKSTKNMPAVKEYRGGRWSTF
jgi:DNA invertase Pin-like site-specific DNA recombinase